MAIDDATGKVAGAVFRGKEDAHGCFMMMREVITKHGVPESVYHDRHGIFERDPKDEEAIWEQLEGKRAPTQFGRLMQELGIRQISANSPQAKGRVERLWGTFQDRLVSELRLSSASTLEEADLVLRHVVAEHNRRFARKPDDPVSVYRAPDKRMDLDGLFCFKYRRTVANDNTVPFYGRVIQIGSGPGGRSYSRCRVEVQERFDGSLHIYYQSQHIAKTDPAPVRPAVVRVRHTNGCFIEECPWTRSETPEVEESAAPSVDSLQQPAKSRKPSDNHPWRRYRVTKSLSDKG